MQPRELLAQLARVAPRERDALCEQLLGIDGPAPATAPGEHLIGYHASGVAAVLRMLLELSLGADDVVIDLGSGLGKVLLLTSLLSAASARGVELQPGLVARASSAAERCGVRVRFSCADARRAALDDGSVFYLYAPFVEPVLGEVVARLREVAKRRAIVVCALGVSLERAAPWLVRRPLEAFWLDVYDSGEPGVAPRAARPRSPLLTPDAELIAFERAPRAPPK